MCSEVHSVIWLCGSTLVAVDFHKPNQMIIFHRNPGELGWELYCQMDQLEPLYDALMEAGEDFEIGDFGTYAMTSLRVEKGFRAWGNEVIDTFFPLR